MYGERCEKRAAAQITGIFFVDILSTDHFLFLGCYLYSTQRQMQRQMQNERRILLEHAAEKIGSRITQVNEFVSWTVRDETIRSLMYRSSEQAAIYDENKSCGGADFAGAVFLSTDHTIYACIYPDGR